MIQIKTSPARDELILRKRIKRYFSGSVSSDNYLLNMQISESSREKIHNIKFQSSINKFLNNLAYAQSDGDIYIFGGILRDLAMLGSRGFSSDVDIVVIGQINELFHFLKKYDARLNKFGGFRLHVDNWPVDIWQAEETWAVKNNIIEYQGISSLLGTTILNWDSILMNWRTDKILYKENYFEDICSGTMDIVLFENPNPLGMLVRILRHMQHKEAKRITRRTQEYITKMTRKFSLDEVLCYEKNSYSKVYVDKQIYESFKGFDPIADSEFYNIEKQRSLF